MQADHVYADCAELCRLSATAAAPATPRAMERQGTKLLRRARESEQSRDPGPILFASRSKRTGIWTGGFSESESQESSRVIPRLGSTSVGVEEGSRAGQDELELGLHAHWMQFTVANKKA